MRLIPFAGIRFGPAAGNPARLAAPPFDQIDDGLRDRLHAEPLQFAQLTKPRPDAPNGPASHAAELYRRWRAEGLVGPDPRPSLYPYEIELAGGERRLGVCGLVGLEPPESGVVVPHERTVAKTVAERLELLRATGCDLEPILLLADDDGALDRALAPAVESETPLVEHQDLSGNRHRLYRVEDPVVLDSWRNLLADRRAIIADGNHRWQVARNHAEELRPEAGSAAACKLAVMTSLASPAVSIDPIHCGLAAPVELEPAMAKIERASWSGDGGRQLAADVAAAGQTALGVLRGPGRAEIWRFREASPLPPARAALIVCRLHDELLPRLGFAPTAATDGSLNYRSDPGKLWQEVADGRLSCGFILPPMSAAAFGAALELGGLLPPKCTRFLPKLESGLVWSEY